METETKTHVEEKKKRIEAKPLPVNKEKAKEIEEQMMHPKSETKKEEKKDEVKENKKEKAEIKVEKVKKTEAVANGLSLPISKKHSMYIGSFIKNKTIDKAISDLTRVIGFKQAVPFKGEIPHRKGLPGPGRYPINASKSFITLLKGLKGNAIVNGMDLDRTRIYIVSPSWARRPAKSGGRYGKRTNIILKAKEFSENKQSQEDKK